MAPDKIDIWKTHRNSKTNKKIRIRPYVGPLVTITDISKAFPSASTIHTRLRLSTNTNRNLKLFYAKPSAIAPATKDANKVKPSTTANSADQEESSCQDTYCTTKSST